MTVLVGWSKNSQQFYIINKYKRFKLKTSKEPICYLDRCQIKRTADQNVFAVSPNLSLGPKFINWGNKYISALYVLIFLSMIFISEPGSRFSPIRLKVSFLCSCSRRYWYIGSFLLVVFFNNIILMIVIIIIS